MELKEYIAQAKEDLDKFAKEYGEGQKKHGFPIYLTKKEWEDQELAGRFDIIP